MHKCDMVLYCYEFQKFLSVVVQPRDHKFRKSRLWWDLIKAEM